MTVNPVAVIRYQYDNHLGSASLELDENANIISYEEYHPFGTTSYRSGRTETETSQKRYKYVGKERDEETGLYYYGFRYYAAWLCRFVSVDSLQFEYPHYTPYQYAGNKPISYIDLDGLEEDKPKKKNITREQFIKKSEEYVIANPNKTYGFDAKKPTPTPEEVKKGAKVDCSGFIRSIMIQLGLPDPFLDDKGKWKKGYPTIKEDIIIMGLL